MNKNRIKIVSCFYNPGIFLDRCISSILSQNYDNFHVIFVDDASTDDSFEKLKAISTDARVTIVRNESRKTALENIHNAILNYCEPNDIVTLVDGDDWLADEGSLAHINDFFNEHDPLFAYGQARWTNGNTDRASAFTEEEFKDIRSAPFRVSHIRNIRAKLYFAIKDQDPDYSCLKDSNGEFYKTAYDVAICIPLMEIAGFNRVKFDSYITYIHNRDNPISDRIVDPVGQLAAHHEILTKPRFKQVSM